MAEKAVSVAEKYADINTHTKIIIICGTISLIFYSNPFLAATNTKRHIRTYYAQICLHILNIIAITIVATVAVHYYLLRNFL